MSKTEKQCPLQPTVPMIDAGAQRLVRWEDGAVWPDSFDPLHVAAARQEAERVWRSMWLEVEDVPPDLQELAKAAGFTLTPIITDAEADAIRRSMGEWLYAKDYDTLRNLLERNKR